MSDYKDAQDAFFQQQEDLAVDAVATEINEISARLRKRGFGKVVESLHKISHRHLKQPQSEVLETLRKFESSILPPSS